MITVFGGDYGGDARSSGPPSQSFLHLPRSRLWEIGIALLLIAFTLFRPGFWMDYISPPYQQVDPAEIVKVMGEVEPGTELRALVDGLDDVGDPITLTMLIPVGDEPDGEQRLEAFGLEILEQDGKVLVDNALFDSKAQEAGFDFDQVIRQLLVPAPQPSRYLLYIPALALLALVFFLQRRRAEAEPVASEQGA